MVTSVRRTHLGFPLHAEMMAQMPFNTARCSVTVSCRVCTSGSSFKIKLNKSSESVVPLMYSNSSSLS